MSRLVNSTITAVPGVVAGHASDTANRTGCTVLLGPFRAAIDIRGLATGTREIDALSPNHLVHQIDAILLTGGSAPGLAAADGVVQWLRERGRGFDVGVTRIPIVPAAVIFDIHTAGQRSPDSALGRAACDAASTEPLRQGSVGAGTGATVGKVRGPEYSARGGIGTFAVRHGPYTVGVLAVVNAFGDVLDHDGSILAGARADDGSTIDSMRAALNARGDVDFAITNTTLCAIATDAPLSRVALQTVARMGSSAIVRRIAPANTVFDGDLVFAVSTSDHVREYPPAELLSIGTAAQLALEEAIVRAVRLDPQPREP
ncbi:MAG TPA: P1 family peptidase [Longimicrobiales bacterium]|nr:P1 family peptidase [Longimicrobiales bacterium]